MATHRFTIAKPDILSYFDGMPLRAFKRHQITTILDNNRDFWRLAKRMTTDEFIALLQRHGQLREWRFPFPNQTITVYSWGEMPLMQLLGHLYVDGYFSHYTAAKLHGWTEQDPKTLYLTRESAIARGDELNQTKIDAAFRKPVRLTNNVATFGDLRVCVLNGPINGLGIKIGMPFPEQPNITVRYTSIERTLIDSTVRPIYAGGVAEVLNFYESSRNEISVNQLRNILKKMDFIYPYHQAIGFYLERAGVKGPALDLIMEIPKDFDFYLTHAMTETDYDHKWRLYIPKGF